MTATAARPQQQPIRSTIPARLDRLRWTPFHTRLVLGLGTAWVLDGLRSLHHPLRAARSETYIQPGLEMLQDIQRTGDIFFPKRWMDATVGGHRSPAAARSAEDGAFVCPSPVGHRRGGCF